MVRGVVRPTDREVASYDVALFVGTSIWLPKPENPGSPALAARELRCGLLSTDTSAPEAYALPIRYAGYKANYYEPEVYRTLLDCSGFDGFGTEIKSGRDGGA